MDETLLGILQLVESIGPSAVIGVVIAVSVFFVVKAQNSQVQSDAKVKITQAELFQSQVVRLNRIEDERSMLGATVGRLQSQVSDLTQKVETLFTELVETKAQRDDLKYEAEKLKDEVEQLRKKLEASDNLNIKLVQENAVFSLQVDELERRLKEIEAKIKTPL